MAVVEVVLLTHNQEVHMLVVNQLITTIQGLNGFLSQFRHDEVKNEP